jgi:hypothetical protein
MRSSFQYTLLIFFCCTCAFSQCQNVYIDSGIKVDKYNIPLNINVPYCPAELLPKVAMRRDNAGDTSITYVSNIIVKSVDSTESKNISRFLFLMKEPLLYNIQFNKEVYRFTWLRPVHESIVIRIEKDSCFINLFWKKSSGDGISRSVRLYDQGKIKLSLKDWEGFMDLLDSTHFWNLQREGMLLEDTSEWILEGVTPDKYYITTMYCPEIDGYFYKTCMFLLKLADIEVGSFEIHD